MPHQTAQFDEATALSRRPRLRPGLIERHGLVERLREGRDMPLTLVCAPAGYGKTTLLAQWEALDGRSRPFAWVALDERDSDPVRLWRHLITALRAANQGIGDSSLDALTAGPGAITDAVLPRLIDELRETAPLVLILDDWHVVRNPQCDATLSAFVERAGPAVQVVISSRSDPGVQVARLRAHGDLIEVRADDLRLSVAEATTLVRETCIELEPHDIERLTARTEGWLAGFCLALLAVKEQDDPQQFVTDFSGTTRTILDFLARDVLSAVAPDVREFLLRTSVLDRLTPALCNAVLEISDSAAKLADVHSANLFLVSLDEAGVEYRYHRLFSTMLRRELEATSPDAVRGLYTRASQWHEGMGHVDDAVDCAIAAGDVARASRLVTRNAQAYWTSGRLDTVVAWLAALSWPAALADRQLALVRAGVCGLAAQGREAVEHWLAIAEAGADEGPLDNGMASLRAGVALVRSTYLTRGIDLAVGEAKCALELEPPASQWRAPALVALGQALYLAGRNDEARVILDEARTMPGATERAPSAALGLSYLALVSLADGDVAGAERSARAAVGLLDECEIASGIAAANPHLALGCALAQGPDLRGAIEHLERAVALTPSVVASYRRAHALLRLASARHRVGGDVGARQALELARADLYELPDEGVLAEVALEIEDELLAQPRRDGFLGDALSKSELRIMSRLVAGCSITEVAQELWLSPNTVKTHRRSIYRKLGVDSREGLRKRSLELRILDEYAYESLAS